MSKNLYFLVLAFVDLSSPIAQAYSKVSRYGQARSGPGDVAFTLSPVYAPTQRTTVDLRPGEVVNHPSTPKYTTLDEQLVSQLDATGGRKQKKPQERFHPPASFEHVLSHANVMRQQQQKPGNQIPVASSSSSAKDVMYPKPVVSMTYDYPSSAQTALQPTIVKDSPFPSYAAPFPETYPPKPIGAGKPPSYELSHPPKASLDYPDHYSPYHPEDDIIYEDPNVDHHHQPPFHHYHHHHHPTTTTMEPEPMDQRLNNRQHYSYYYIGKKLWYVPLYFSIYFIIYIAALVLKSIARHKINFPANLAAVAAGNARSRDDDTTGQPGWMDYAAWVLEAIDNGRGRKSSNG